MHDSLQLLHIYAPTLFECAAKNSTTATKVADKYQERLCSVARAIERQGAFEAMTCIFDLLWNAVEGKNLAREFLAFIDRITRIALDCTEGTAHSQVESLAVRMILSFGNERSEYKNHFAELAVIAKLVEYREFELVSIEKPLANGRHMDLEVRKGDTVNLIEVYNIDFRIEKLNSSAELRHFLEARLLKKLQVKLDGVSLESLAYQIVPVLWGDIMALTNFVDAFEYFKQVKIVGPFMMVAQYRNQLDDRVEYDFQSVQDFLHRARRSLGE